MPKKPSIKVPHPKQGWVIFENPSLREQEVLEDYLNLKKSQSNFNKVGNSLQGKMDNFNADLYKEKKEHGH